MSATMVCDGDTCRMVPAGASAAASAGTTLSALLGDSLLSHQGVVPTTSIAGPSKVIALYFSAHWCPPCRGFTPQLASLYQDFKASHASKDDFSIVFVSSDRDEESFNSYFKEMPWLALPFDKRDLKGQLSAKFKVQGIPSLIILDAATGEVINSNGRAAVTEDPSGFPWRPQSFAELMQDAELINKEGQTFKAQEALAGKIKLVYFSAHWCPPCRGFTPELAKTYAALKAAGKNFETVFISSDRDEASFKEYLSEMPWLALVHSDRKRKDKLSSAMEVEGIPTLVVLDENNKVITQNGRGAVASDPLGADFPWHPKPLNLLDESSVDSLNQGPCMVLCLDTEDVAAAKAKAEGLLEATATAAMAASAAGKQDEVNFVWGVGSDSPGSLMGRLLQYVGDAYEAGKGDKVFITDIPSQVLYRWSGQGPFTAEAAAKLLSDFLAGNLEKVKIGSELGEGEY